MKKLLTMVMAAVMAISAMGMTAFAANEADDQNISISEEMTNIMEQSKEFVIVVEENEVKQVTPIYGFDMQNISTDIQGDKVVLLNKEGTVLDEIPITFDVTDRESLSTYAVTKRTVNRDGTELRSAPAGNADVVLTLEKGVTFYQIEYHAPYAHGYVNLPGNTSMWGYVLGIF